MRKKCHQWTTKDETKLLLAIEECKPLFEHYKEQSSAYTELNAWDAIAGRLLPEIVVTGAACKRRFEKLNEKKQEGWDDVIEMVNVYERELAETTFDGVSELLGNMDALFDEIKALRSEMKKLRDMWK